MTKRVGPRGEGSLPTPGPVGALGVPFVRAIIVGRASAAMAMQFISVAVGWELYERTGDPWALGLVGAVQVVPALLLMLPAGNVADRFPRRNVAMLAHGVLGLVALGLAAVSWLQAPIELVFGLLLLAGVARAFAGPSANTILPQLLEPRQLATANAWQVSGVQLAMISGPAVGGALIAISGAATSSYVAAAVGQLVFVGLLTTLPTVATPPRAGRHDLGEVLAGVTFIRRSPVYLAAITLDMFAVLLGGAVALMPVFAKDILQVGPGGLGLLRAAPPLGALTTALIVTRLPPWQRPGRVLLLVVAGFGVATIGFGLSRHLALSLACLFFVGAFDSVSVVIRHTLQQVITPDHLRGRVAAVNSLFLGLSNELGAFESGATAALFGPVISVVGGGIGTLAVVAVVALAWPALARIGALHTLRPVDARADRPSASAAEAAQA